MFGSGIRPSRFTLLPGRSESGAGWLSRVDHLAFMPPPLAGLPFFPITGFEPLAVPLPALPIAMPLPALSLYTGNPITT